MATITEPTSKLKKWGLVLILSLALFIMIVDTTMMNVSIRDLVVDLDSSIKDIQWAVTIYSLVMAAFMIAGGKLGDIWGRKKTFLTGVSIYGIGTLTAALSPNVGTLIFGWSIPCGIKVREAV